MFKTIDLRLFEEIGGNIQEKKKKKTRLAEENKKSTFRAFSRELIN